jgi:hypothetical protein
MRSKWLPIALILCGAIVFVAPRIAPQIIDYFKQVDPSPNPEPNPEPNPPIVIEDVTGSLVLMVFESGSKTVDQDLILRDMRTYCERFKMSGFLRLDDEMEEAVPFNAAAKAKGIEFPYIALLKNKKTIRIAKFPANTTELEAFLK